MDYWNYRVMRQVVNTKRSIGKVVSFGIHEVFYDGKDKVTGWTKDAVAVVGDNVKELKSDLMMMTQALLCPVLDYATGKEWKEPSDGSKG